MVTRRYLRKQFQTILNFLNHRISTLHYLHNNYLLIYSSHVYSKNLWNFNSTKVTPRMYNLILT